MKDFIITSLQNWDSTFGGNAKDIAYELSKKYRVLYINSPVSRVGKSINLRTIQTNLWVLDCDINLLPVNRIPDGRIFDAVNRYNNSKIFKVINEYAAKLQFQNIIHFCDNDIYRSFFAREYLHATLYIYYRRDNLQPVSYWKRHVKRLESALIGKSDIVMCNSAELTEYVKCHSDSSHIYDIGQGVDLSTYRADIKYTPPEEYNKLVPPIIGYIGAISSIRLDVELLYQLASNCPQYTFLFVGKRDDVFTNHPLSALPNVYFTGLKPMSQMPAYTQIMDVCLNPQIVNEVTIGNYPRKVDEYLAMGKPVVATRTRTMELFKDYVYLCSSVIEYQTAIEEALSNDSPNLHEERIAFAHTHSWTHSVEKIYIAIKKYENTKPIQQR